MENENLQENVPRRSSFMGQKILPECAADVSDMEMEWTYTFGE